jgi:hypothetical protein
LIPFTSKSYSPLIRLFLFLIGFFTIESFYSQENEFQTWTELGVKGKINNKLEYGIDITNRFGNNGLETFFPQGSLKYKLTDWFKPSIDYRLIGKKEPNSNYLYSNRLNFNFQFTKQLNRINLGFRIRYQYSFAQLSENYQPEFDRALRIKPSFSYDINKSILTPIASLELFYNPTNGPLGSRFTKVRTIVGLELELNGPHEVEFGYLFDNSINLPFPGYKHVFNVSYCYKIKLKNQQKSEKSKSVRWL